MQSKKLHIWLGMSLLFLCQLSFAQQTYTGYVQDQETSEPLVGATIAVRGAVIGVLTDDKGYFELQGLRDASGLEIAVSYYGYQSKQLTLTEAGPTTIALEAEEKSLDAVVITGLGIKRQQREVGYSTDYVSGDKIALSNAPNVINALSGLSAGVQVVSPNGVDGGTTRITIRGNNNLTGNNQPLIIVDGVPIENPPGLTAIGRGVDWGSAINNINPEDIADISILKGPTASAKYGMRGANGVILITTKRGENREGLGVEYAQTLKMITPFRFRKVQNKYGAGGPISLNEPAFLTNSDGEMVYPQDVHSSNGPFGRPTTEQFGFYSTGVSWGPEMKGQMIRWWDGEMRSFSPQPDNLQQFFETGYTNTHNVSLSKGGDFGSLRTSLTYQNHDAVVPNSHFNQYTANLGARINVSKRITADVAVSYVKFFRKNSPSLGDDNNASFGKGILYSWPRSYQGLERELNFNPDSTRHDYNGNYPFSFTPRHLWWNTYNQNTFLNRNKLIGSFALEYQATNWLNITARTGIDQTNNEFETRNNPIDVFGIQEGLYGREIDQNIVYNHEFLATATKEDLFADGFNLSWSVGGAAWHRHQYGLNVTTDQWVNPWLFAFSNYNGLDQNRIPVPQEIRFDKKINSLFSFLNLSYDNAIFLELSGRNDWSSALPLENNSYFYPSASLSYILSDHLKLDRLKVDFLKLRLSYAKAANDTDPFLLDFVYNIGTFNGNQTASLPNVRPPSELRPQQADSYEAGMTLGMLNSRIDLDLTYYYIQSFDQILESPVPTSSGVSSIRINNGVLENEGWEGRITVNVLERSRSYLKMGLNFTRNRNRVVSLGDGAEQLEIAEIWGDFGPKIMVREGQNYGTIYGYDHVRHENGQPILNEAGTHYEITQTHVPVGNSAPDALLGYTLEGRWRDFTFNALVDAKIGGDVYAGSYVIGLQTGQSPETLYERDGNGLPFTDPDGNVRNVGVVLPGVYADGTPNDKVVHYYYKYLPNAGGWGKIITTPGILDNTWARLREVAISYQFPANFLKKSRVFQGLNLSLVGRDLMYLYASLPDNVNPEGTGGAGNAQGLEWASFPSMRSLSVRIGARF